MKKPEYFEISRKEKLSKRCPILNCCERRAYTIYFYSNFDHKKDDNAWIKHLIKKGELSDDFDTKKIPIQGESCLYTKSPDSFTYSDMCPEVNLFDSWHALLAATGTASSSGTWDKEDGFKNIEYRHFSECPEFSYWKNVLSTSPKRSMRRASISKQLRFEIFQRDNFKCQYCGKSQEDGAKLVIDHKIPVSKGGSDKIENLITSCESCNQGKSDKSI